MLYTAAEYPVPLCLALCQGVFQSKTPRRTLLLLPRSYGLMRQTTHLRLPVVFPRARGLCRLSPVPADGWSFPILSLHSLRRRLDPYPAVPSGCTRPFLPHRPRPRVTGNTLGETELSLPCNFSRELFFEAAVIRYLQAPTLARPPYCTYRTTSRRWAAGPFTPRIAGPVTCLQLWHRYMSDLGQLTLLDFHQLDCSLIGCSFLHYALQRLIYSAAIACSSRYGRYSFGRNNGDCALI